MYCNWVYRVCERFGGIRMAMMVEGDGFAGYSASSESVWIETERWNPEDIQDIESTNTVMSRMMESFMEYVMKF